MHKGDNMDKFTKTTEIDISTMHDVMEEETPKKNNFSKIIAIIVAFVVAIVFCVYIMDTDTTLIVESYEVQVEGTEEFVTVQVKATNSQLADIKEVKVTYGEDGEYVVKFLNRKQEEILFNQAEESPFDDKNYIVEPLK